MSHLAVLLWVVVGLLLVLRIWRRQRARRLDGRQVPGTRRPRATPLGETGMVAGREIRERVRGRLFRVVTVVVLVVVAAVIVIPVISRTKQRLQVVGVVGSLTGPERSAVLASASRVGTSVRFVAEPGRRAARRDLASGRTGFVIIDGREVLVQQAVTPTDTSTTAQLVRASSQALGVQAAFAAAGLSPAQAARVAAAKPVPVRSVEPAPAKGAVRSTSLVGIILVFILLTQYLTWTLVGVMEEKSSRVVEVLLSAVRPMQLLAGKVLGIGAVALAQASIVVAFALVLAKVVGSDLLQGTAPMVVAATLAWLVLGYAFYCWVYAAAGSLAERQDQVQTLALPLSIPLVFGYVVALTAASAGRASTLVTVLAYLPPSAPFAMPVLVGLHAVTWWKFAAAAAISVVTTLGVARLAAAIYERAVLRTGRRVRLRDVMTP